MQTRPSTMTEAHLNSKDKLQLMADIKISMVLGLLLSLAILIIFGLAMGVMLVFGKPSEGFVTRGLCIFVISFTPLLINSWTNILRYIDIKKGEKLIIKSDNYEIVNKKGAAYILTRGDNKQKVKIDDKLIPFIKSPKPLTMEISRFARSLLFISHDNYNLIDKLYNDKNK